MPCSEWCDSYVGDIVVGAILAGPAVDFGLCSEGAGADVGQRARLGGVVGAEGAGDEEEAHKILHHEIFGDIL